MIAKRQRPLVAGIAASLAGALALFLLGEAALEQQREYYFDALTQAVPAAQSDRIVVVDIDRKAFQRLAGEEWTRAETAKLVDRLAAAKPAAIAFDFVFSTDCRVDDPANGALAAAIAKTPTVLGFLIGESLDGAPHPVPALALQRPVIVPDLWFIEGTETSCSFLQDRSVGAAASFLVGDEDAVVRRVQAYAIVGNAAYPALGVEAARIAAGARTPVFGGQPSQAVQTRSARAPSLRPTSCPAPCPPRRSAERSCSSAAACRISAGCAPAPRCRSSRRCRSMPT
jgi:adenylate cyclase